MILQACCSGAQQTACQSSGNVDWHMGQQVIAMVIFACHGGQKGFGGPRADTAGWRSGKLLLLKHDPRQICAPRCGRRTSISMKALPAGRCTRCPGQCTPGTRRRRPSAFWQEVRELARQPLCNPSAIPYSAHDCVPSSSHAMHQKQVQRQFRVLIRSARSPWLDLAIAGVCRMVLNVPSCNVMRVVLKPRCNMGHSACAGTHIGKVLIQVSASEEARSAAH